MLREMGIPPFWPAETVSSEPVEPARPAMAEPSESTHRAAPIVTPAAAPEAPRVVARPAPPMRSVAAVATEGLDDKVRPARPAGVEHMDWPALRDAVAACQACALCESRRQTVFGVGHIEAEWMIVGEAPGEQEDKQGEPFVGRAGVLLDRMLESLKLTRADASAAQQVYIANVLKCRPPANRNPLPQEVAQCEPYLLRQIELVQPKLILAMGRFAVQSLLKSNEAIGRLRGKVHEVSGVPVIVTYHPAYLLRNPADKALVWDDLCLAREVWAQRSM